MVALTLILGLGLVLQAPAQVPDPNNPLLKVDMERQVERKMFDVRTLDPKMSAFDRKMDPKMDSRFQKSVPVRNAQGFAARQVSPSLAGRRWEAGASREVPRATLWDGKQSQVIQRAPMEGAKVEKPMPVQGLSARVEPPKIYLGPENPKARPEAEVIRRTLGSVQNENDLVRHQLSEAEVRKLLMTPERVRKAEAADHDPGITTRAVPVNSPRESTVR